MFPPCNSHDFLLFHINLFSFCPFCAHLISSLFFFFFFLSFFLPPPHFSTASTEYKDANPAPSLREGCPTDAELPCSSVLPAIGEEVCTNKVDPRSSDGAMCQLCARNHSLTDSQEDPEDIPFGRPVIYCSSNSTCEAGPSIDHVDTDATARIGWR